nr:MAG TPA: hypothetical protein [Caudoviricetes sp.]
MRGVQAYELTKAQQLPKTSAHKLINSKAPPTQKTYQLNSSSIQKFHNSKTPQLKNLNGYLLFYSITPNPAPF